MKRITTDTCYREVDQLDGIDLKQGEQLKVQWKDGAITTETVEIESSYKSYYGHGDVGEIIVNKASVVRIINGNTFRCYLKQHSILCERVLP